MSDWADDMNHWDDEQAIARGDPLPDYPPPRADAAPSEPPARLCADCGKPDWNVSHGAGGHAFRAAPSEPVAFIARDGEPLEPDLPSEPERPALDAAWAEVVNALRPGNYGPFVGPESIEGGFVAWAWTRHGPDAEPIEGFGPTPTAALHSLAARLATPASEEAGKP